MPSFLKPNVVKLGDDVGWCLHDDDLDDPDDASIFSSIFHEVLFGLCEELVFYKDSLNEHLLFPTKALAESYVKTHDRLSAEGKDVEDYMEMVIYEVWRHQTDIVPLG